MRELHFHVGLHKTGSTFLQHMLLANRDRFRAAGLDLAPGFHPREANHYPLLQRLEAAGYDPAVAREIFDEIARAPGDRLLVTAEELSWVMADPARAAVVAAAAARHFDLHAIIWLRRQDFHKESQFAQVVKTWYAGAIADETDYDYDHDARLATLEARFGPGKVHVLLYREGKPDPATDPVAGLIAALGLDLDRSTLAPVPHANVSLHRRLVLFLSELPKPAAAATARAPMRFGLRVAAAVRAAKVIADDGGRFLMSPAERHDLVARHLAGNRALVARHGLQGPAAEAFLALPDPAAAWTPPAPITQAERFAAFRATLRAAWRRRNFLAAATESARVVHAFARFPVRPAAGATASRATDSAATLAPSGGLPSGGS